MIELKEVKKVYKSKKGLSTEALKGINLKLSEKGLTFILGKSGSGKSTLLNILGGLDTYDSGDIIVNGKSTKEFKEKDWDAYRNTYIGFIFQEFNLLDNYTIEDNIKLAMELQHKKCSNSDILNVLKMVELEDVLKRKPNELSGGQKQRIAIARALIKNPKIILADEPTGNLDSETSKQVFNILKKLSKEKLIVVVSHDEESANKYADRIIKIADGMIKSDTNKNNIINSETCELVNAKFPFLYSLKMGLGNLLHKKFRLFFSTLLIILCLVCFGTMISTLNSNVNEEYIKVFEEKGSTEVYINKYKDKVVYEKIFSEEMKHFLDLDALTNIYPKREELDNNFLNEVSKKTNMKWFGEYNITNNFEPLNWIYVSSPNDSDMIYYYIGDAPVSKSIKTVIYDDDLLKDEKIIGNKVAKEDEVIVSSFIADQIIHNGILSKKDKNQTKTETYKPNNYEEIINDQVYINFGNMIYVKIVGIIDYKEYLKKYSDLKEIKVMTLWDMNENKDRRKIEELYSNLINDANTFLTRVYVNEEFINKLDLKEENISNSTTRLFHNNKLYYVDQFAYFNKEENIYRQDGIVKMSSLSNDEIILNTYMLNIITEGDYYKKLEEYKINNYTENTSEFLKNYIIDNNIIGKKIKSSISNKKIYNDSDNFAEYKIVGIINDNNDYGLTYYNKEAVKDLISKNIKLNTIFRNVETVSQLKTILEYYPINNSNILSESKYSNNLLASIEFSYLFRLVGKYGTIFFLVFSVILLMNFISNSIRFRKKEIGILRAIGCRSKDVIMMFIYECLTLMIFCLLISFLIIPKIVKIVNSFISSTLYVEMNVMKFGSTQILGVTLVMVLIVILSSIIPIKKLTKSKPIDTILDK